MREAKAAETGLGNANDLGFTDHEVERGFEAEIDGKVILFIPSSPYEAKIRRDDEAILWLAHVQKPELSRFVDERVSVRRQASEDEVIAGYLAARRVRALCPPVRQLLRIASVVYCGNSWQAEAAADLGVSEADVTSWLEGREPPDWLETKLLALMPRLAFAQRRHRWLALVAGDMLDAMGGYDEASWRYPEPASGPEDF